MRGMTGKWKRKTARDVKLTAELLREVLHYDPETGIFTWKTSVGSRGRAGAVVASKHNAGYLVVRLCKRAHLLHRLAYFYMTGELPEWPQVEIDHLNGIRTDNRWCNLRACTKAVNTQNLRHARSMSKTGVLGVSPSRTEGKFRATVTIAGKQHGKEFSTIAEARQYYIAVKRQLHPGCTL